MNQFKSQGKYFPRSSLFSTAQHYWTFQFFNCIKQCGGNTPTYLQYEV